MLLPARVGSPRAMTARTLGRIRPRPQQAHSAIAEPKLKPATTTGRRYSRSSQSSAASTSSASAFPSCFPWLRPVPRKLKRSTENPKPHSPALRTFIARYTTLWCMVPPYSGLGWQTRAAKGASGEPVFRSASSLPAGPSNSMLRIVPAGLAPGCESETAAFIPPFILTRASPAVLAQVCRRGPERRLRYSGSIMIAISSLDPIGFTRQLCEIESTTYHEGPIGDFLAEFLSGRGWAVEKTAVEQPRESAAAGPRWNVYAGIAGQEPDLVFSTHMDTVPPYIPFREDAEFIYGRGVCDAKGIIAAQVAAAEALRAAGFHVGLLFVSGEERDSAGARAANLVPKGSRFLINGEPTDNRLALASKGALRAVFRSIGRMAHSAYPELGDSATEKLVRALAKILEIPLPTLEDVGPSTLNIGTLGGGHAPNVIADSAEA